MDCPVCKEVKLVMADRQGIEIDYCPNCRGVWLDRGELDKIVDRSAGASVQRVQHQPQHDPYQNRQSQGCGSSHRSHGHSVPQQSYPNKKKRNGFLGELFDFD